MISKIWNSNIEVAKNSLDQLVNQGFIIKTDSEYIYNRILSCFYGTDLSIFNNFELKLINNNFFHLELDRLYNNGTDHENILLEAIYHTGEHHSSDINKDLQNEIKIRAKERKLKEATKRFSLLENTYKEEIDELCPLDRDGSSFYYYNPNTKENELLKPHHIFHVKGHCYDIDAIFQYIRSGGRINLDDSYIKKFFNDKGMVDFSNQGLTSSLLDNKTYHKGTKNINLENNMITTLHNINLPNELLILSIDNNPLGDNYKLNKCDDLQILSMRNCDLTVVDFKYLPKYLIKLDLSENKLLTSLHGISNLKNLRELNISETGIKKIEYSKFFKLREKNDNSKLTIICNRNVEVNQTGLDWIEVEYV